MRLPRVQFTMRGSMVAIAIIAVLFVVTQTGVKYVRWRRMLPAYDQRARFHKQHERVTIIRARDTRTGRVLHTDELVGLNQEYAAYHGALRRKFEYARTHPWASLPDDPPDPIQDRRPELSIDTHYP